MINSCREFKMTKTMELPEGTPFQQAVWAELLTIPAGQVVSYGEIALRIGRPRAVRAVGTAVGANPCAPDIPCHRVVPQAFIDGKSRDPGGYAYGAAKKRALLKAEGLDL